MEFMCLDSHLKAVMSFVCAFYIIFRLMNRETAIVFKC